MQDFIRIGGAITSSPLNEDFRRLLNAISIANTNLVFPEGQGIVNNMTELMNIEDPIDAQACYVISSGELYRYSKKDNKWHKIMDIGATFRQGFLNSGAVVLEDDIKLKDDSHTIMTLPRMLVYFKNKEGDAKYLKGMYLIESQDLDISSIASSAGAYSIFTDELGNLTIQANMPTQDNVNLVFLATFVVGTNGEIYSNDFIYTFPDIAYTADRGHFFVYGGEANGLNLIGAGQNKVNRVKGYYYDEGINFAKSPIEEFPYNVDNGANYNLKYYPATTSIDTLYYMTPEDGLTQGLTASTGLINNRRWDSVNKLLVEVPDGYFTIQHHLLTPTGQNIIVYGRQIYNSMADATSNLNNGESLDVGFPYVQATKIVVGNIPGEFDTLDSNTCRFFTLTRLSQAGTISPEFADNVFKLYSGDADDNTPAYMRFNLRELQAEDFTSLYNLDILPSEVNRKLFYNNKKYIRGLGSQAQTSDVTKDIDEIRTTNSLTGYKISDQEDLNYLINRVNNIEAELWDTYDNSRARYEQSVRYRLFWAEDRLDTAETTLEDHRTRIDALEYGRVKKETTINGYALGDISSKTDYSSVQLYTGDISEGRGLSSSTNLWYTDERVNNNTHVSDAYEHLQLISLDDDALVHDVVNPHHLSTDDINLLTNTTKIFVTPEEERRIRADRLPDNTIQAIQDVDDKNMDALNIKHLEGSSESPGGGPFEFGNVKSICFYDSGVNMSLNQDGTMAYIECVGRVNEDRVMMKNRYATLEAQYPDQFGGYVDNAVNAEYADNVHGIELAGPNKYYGTDDSGTVGLLDIPKYVSSADAGSYASIDQITFIPMDGSVQERHLETSLRNKINNNYHTIQDGGVLKSNEINTFNFGSNLNVSVSGNTATINATGSGGTGGVTEFADLTDVNVIYTGNEGKAIVINDDGTGLVVSNAPAMSSYMLKAVYVDDDDVSKVKKARTADNATLATTAINSATVNEKSVDDTKTTNAYLWTAAKIISNTSTQIANEGVRTYNGTSVPSASLGKDGDIYVLTD